MIEKKIFLIGFWPDYETFFFENLSVNGYSFTLIDLQKKIDEKPFLSKLPRYFKNKVYKKIVEETVVENKKSIFFFQEHRLIIEFLIKNRISCYGNILFRNPIRSNTITVENIRKLKVLGYNVWSFDPDDCENYNLSNYNQIIKPYKDIQNTKIMFDFSFVGRNKNRDVYFSKLKSLASFNELSINLNIRGNNKKFSISYKDYLTEQCQGKCIIDIVQDKQSGLTLRPLEAMIYRRKLITNNKTIEKSDFYHPNNIYVLHDIGKLDDINEFINKPYVDVTKKVEALHSPNNVFKEMLTNH